MAPPHVGKDGIARPNVTTPPGRPPKRLPGVTFPAGLASLTGDARLRGRRCRPAGERRTHDPHSKPHNRGRAAGLASLPGECPPVLPDRAAARPARADGPRATELRGA